MKIAKQILAITLAAFTLLSCEKDPIVEKPGPDKPGTENPENPDKDPEDGKEDEDKPKMYSISLKAESEFYDVDFPQEAAEGENVTVKVTPVENVFIDNVRFNSTKANAVAGKENTFEFKMPKRNVTLTVNSSSTVTVLPNSYFVGQADKEVAAAGDLVTVVFGVYNVNDVVSSAKVNGTINCTLTDMDMGIYVYTFTMPEGPAVVEGFMETEYHVIEREGDEHCTINMLDCINNQGTPEEFCSQKSGEIVHFIYRWDLGYDVVCTVTGTKSGKDYSNEVFWSIAADNHLYQDCWAFYMPDEPVLIKTVSTERNTYEGQGFVGEYTGYWITADGNNLIYNSAQPAMNLDLRKSGAFYVKTTDSNAYDFSGIYSVDNGRIASDREEARGDFALRGEVLENGYAFAIVDNILHDNVDNRRFYLVGKNNFEFVCASDKYATRFLLEANEGGQKSWYFIERDNQSISKAEVTFLSGNSIADASEAMVKVEGGIAFNRTEEFKYTNSNGTSPVFTYCGKEVGTYTSDKGETLVLDGFGRGTYNGTEGTYTIADGVVTFTDKSGNATKMNTDINNHTFKIVNEASEETIKALASEYKTTTAKVSHNGTVTENGTLFLAIDRNYYGDYYKGYAQYKFFFVADGGEVEIIGGTKKYVIDEVERTLTLPQVVQGDGVTPHATVKKDLVFKISDDFKTLTLMDTVYSSEPKDFCYEGAVLHAVEQ